MVTVEEVVVELINTRFTWFKYVESAKVGETHRFSAFLEEWYADMWYPLPGKTVIFHCLRPDGVDDAVTLITDSEGFVIRDITFDTAGSYEIWVEFEGDETHNPSETSHLY